jgi:hypothetical protein
MMFAVDCGQAWQWIMFEGRKTFAVEKISADRSPNTFTIPVYGLSINHDQERLETSLLILSRKKKGGVNDN